MLGLALMMFCVIYFYIWRFCTRYTYRRMIRKGYTKRQAFWSGFAVFFAFFALAFWEYIPAQIIYTYYCQFESGGKILKPLEEWKRENPDIYEALQSKNKTYIESIKVKPYRFGLIEYNGNKYHLSISGNKFINRYRYYRNIYFRMVDEYIYIYKDVKNNEDLLIIKEYSTGWPWLSDNGDPNFRRFNLSRESCCKWSSDWNVYTSILMP